MQTHPSIYLGNDGRAVEIDSTLSRRRNTFIILLWLTQDDFARQRGSRTTKELRVCMKLEKQKLDYTKEGAIGVWVYQMNSKKQALRWVFLTQFVFLENKTMSF